MKHSWFTIVLALCLALSLTSSAGLAQGGAPGSAQPAPSLIENVRNRIPVQGRLTNAGGTPLTGIYDITFALYEVESGGTEICGDTNSVTVTNGLFYSEIYGNCPGVLTGQQVWLGIKVGADAEMTPRQPIYAVPYAWSLIPGANVIGSAPGVPVLHVENTGEGGRALRAYATSPTGTNYGVVGGVNSPTSLGGYFYNTGAGVGLKADSETGIGLQGESTSGVAIKATGSGIIQSSANSYVWISGNGLRPYLHTNSTMIDMNSVGGAKVIGGGIGFRSVMLPITITGPLYGQSVKVVGLDINYLTSSDMDTLTTVRLRRQIKICTGTDCYVEMKADTADHTCQEPGGCTLTYPIASDNELTSTSGVLYLTLEMYFSSNTAWVEVGGARLTLEHD